MLIDVAISADRNVVKKEVEKKLKYKSLCIEIQRMWNLKCKIIPIITGPTRIATKWFKEKFGSHTTKTSNIFTTKTATLGISHIIQ